MCPLELRPSQAGAMLQVKVRESHGAGHVRVPLVREYLAAPDFPQSVVVGDGFYLPGFAGIWILDHPVLLADLYREPRAAAELDRQAIHKSQRMRDSRDVVAPFNVHVSTVHDARERPVQGLSEVLYGLAFGPTRQGARSYWGRANGRSMTTLITPGSASGAS